jgi:dephospho-CoA kinase
MPREEKVRFANDIIKNDSSVEKLKSNIEELHKKYLTFACEK